MILIYWANCIYAIMKTGIKVNAKKIKHMLNMNAGQNHDVQIANKSFKTLQSLII
jgi:hypothetical protein